MMKSKRLSRGILSGSLLLIASAFALAMTPKEEEPDIQACDGTAVAYDIPAGESTGWGNSKFRAKMAAASNAGDEMGLSLNPCEVYEEDRECPSSRFNHIEGWEQQPPVYDNVVNAWKGTVTWDASTIDQTCDECP